MNHAKFGGSSAARWMNCAGSTSLLEQVPKRPAGMAAQVGTAQHTVMELLINDADKHPDAFLGATVEGIRLGEDEIGAIKVALEAFDMLAAKHPGGIWAEQRVELEPEAWGTSDILFHHNDHLVVADFKFGQIVVEAEANAQAMFYAAAARKTLGLKPKTIELVIIQPTMDPAIDSHTVTAEDLTAFEMSLYAALKAARSPMPTFAEGKWCKWCDAKLVCPLKTQRLATLTAPNHILDLAELGDRLAKIRSWDDWREEAEDRIHHELEHGVAVPGWKLVNKRAVRQWNDEALTAKTFADQGISEDTYIKKQLITPAQAEKKKLKIDGLASPVSSGTTIATQDDKRPEVLPAAAIGQALKQLGA